jgi:hypothetical protein
VIALNLFVAVIPLIIIGYAFIEAFNPHRDAGNLLASDLHLTGSTAQIVRGTFSSAGSGKPHNSSAAPAFLPSSTPTVRSGAVHPWCRRPRR